MTIQSFNPSTKELLGEVEKTPKSDIIKKVAEARFALKSWKQLGVEGRVLALRKVVQNFVNKEQQFAELISKEMGMPVSQSIHDVRGAIDYFNWYLDNAEKYLSPEIVFEDDHMLHKVHFEPIGVVAAITPWNFPASNLVWMVGQNLVVGNTVVFKDSKEVPLCGKFIEEQFADAHLPKGVFSEIYGDKTEGDILIHQDINMICFTGSTPIGKYLYKIGAEKFIKVFLELGGSAPGIVREDADIDSVIDTIYANRFDNCGQICDGLKRLIVHKSKVDEVIRKLKKKLELVIIGDAINPTTDIGPLVSEKQLLALKEQVADAISKGAKIECSIKVPKNLPGYFYSPTILIDVQKNMRVWTEEVFGPVLPVMTFETDGEAVALANDTEYGLGGYIFTTDKVRFDQMASQVDTGMIQMNNAGYVQPPTPFGGCKSSGIGREHGRFGFQELSSIKVIAAEK